MQLSRAEKFLLCGLVSGRKSVPELRAHLARVLEASAAAQGGAVPPEREVRAFVQRLREARLLRPWEPRAAPGQAVLEGEWYCITDLGVAAVLEAERRSRSGRAEATSQAQPARKPYGGDKETV